MIYVDGMSVLKLSKKFIDFVSDGKNRKKKTFVNQNVFAIESSNYVNTDMSYKNFGDPSLDVRLPRICLNSTCLAS